LLQILREDLLILGEHVGEFDGGLWRIAIALDERQQEFHRARVAAQCVVDEPTQHPFDGGNPARLATFRDRDLLSNDILQDRPDGPRAPGTPLRIAALSWSEPFSFWRTTIADAVFGGRPGLTMEIVLLFIRRDNTRNVNAG
jgi:hypothetical protein